MRKVSFVVIIVVVLGALPAVAQPPREERDTIQRLVRAIRSVFRPQTTGDIHHVGSDERGFVRHER